MVLVDNYQKLLNYEPNYAEAYANLGNVFTELNMHDESLAAYNTAIILNPNLAEVYSNRGNVLQDLKKYKEALEDYNKAILIKPDFASAYSNRGIVQKELALFDDALASYDEAIKNNPNYAEVYYNRGIVLSELTLFSEALFNYDRAILINPDYVEAYSNRGNVLKHLNRLDEALASYDLAINLKPDYFEAYCNRGIALNDLRRFNEALASFDQAIEINPDYVNAYFNRGNALKDLNRLDEAIASYDRAIEINPDYVDAYSNRGNALKDLNRFDEALASYAHAIKINPNFADAYTNQGVALQELKRIDEAMSSYDSAISQDPEHAEAYHNKGMLLLMTDKFKDGWFFYKWRWNLKAKISNKFHTKIPNWDGQTDGKSIKILLWGEQGIGDEIFYFGMLKNFTKISARITVAADNRLHSLFKRSMPEAEFIDRKKIDTECNENSFDYQAPIGDIGLLCSVDPLIDFKLPKPFLHINKFRCSDFENKKHIFKDKVVCGLSWKSSNKKIGLSKSLDLIDLSPLLLIENVEFVSLQYGSTKDEINFVENKIGKKIHTVDDLDIYNDIDGLVSLIYDCDFVVTTSNITAHLTGAIGKKGIVILPFSKGKIWYWHSGEGQSAWYPSLELTSQIQMNDWKEPINKCKEWVLEQI
jgi:tetratricopeptide (TPR) repeat protein